MLVLCAVCCNPHPIYHTPMHYPHLIDDSISHNSQVDPLENVPSANISNPAHIPEIEKARRSEVLLHRILSSLP